MKASRRALAGIVMISSSLGLLPLAAATPATAAGSVDVSSQASTDGFDRCPEANFCIFEHSKGRGLYGATFHDKKDLTDSRVWSGKMNDRTSSIRVNRAEPWCVYTDKNYKGNSLMLAPGRTYDFRKAELRYWNDKISSFAEADLVRDWPWSQPHRQC